MICFSLFSPSLITFFFTGCPFLQAFKTKEELSTAAASSASSTPSSSSTSTSSTSSSSSGSSSGRGFLSFLGSTVESISHTLQTTAGSGSSGSGSGSGSQHSGEPDQWFDAKKNYITALEIHLNSLLKAINSMIKKRKGVRQEENTT